MTTALTTINGLPSEHEIAVLNTMAKTASESKFFSRIGGVQGVLTIMLYARELGIPVMQALAGGIHIIEGKPEISARQINAAIRKAGHVLSIKQADNKACTIYAKRADTGEEHTETYSIQDAQMAGLVRQGSGWTKNPSDMLFARCISRIGRRLFPDVIGEAYVEGEIQERIPANVVKMGDDNGKTIQAEPEKKTLPPLADTPGETPQQGQEQAAPGGIPSPQVITPAPLPSFTVKIDGKSVQITTAGILEDTFNRIAEYQRKGEAEKKALLDYLAGRKLRELTEDEGKAFLNQTTPKSEDPKVLNKVFWAKLNDAGFKDLTDKAKVFFKQLYQFESFSNATALDMQNCIGLLDEYLDDERGRKALRTTLECIVIPETKEAEVA